MPGQRLLVLMEGQGERGWPDAGGAPSGGGRFRRWAGVFGGAVKEAVRCGSDQRKRAPVDQDWSVWSGVWSPAIQGANRVECPAGCAQGCRERGPQTGAIVG